MNVIHAGIELEKKILAGQCGRSGDRFLSAREMMREVPCSYVTATKIADWLRERNVIMLYGRNHYITTGRCAIDSELERRLKPTRHQCFGVLFNTVDNQYYAMMSTQLHRAARVLGYDLMIMVNASEEALGEHQLNLMLEMGVSGVFFFPHFRLTNLKLYNYYPLPMVVVGRRMNTCTRNAVAVNNYMVGSLAARHLLECGYEDFLYIGMLQNRQIADQRKDGFRDCLVQAGMPVSEENMLFIAYDEASQDMSAVRERLNQMKRPTGVFCYHDLIASSCLQMCLEQGIRIPQEVGIIGCDDLPITTVSAPTLSSIHYPYTRICQTAVDLMVNELTLGTENPRFIEVQPRLVIRQSTSRNGFLDASGMVQR